jgi:CheY-like chemotaxis protein
MRRPRILLVDDNPNLTSMIRVFLSRIGRYEVREENRSPAAMASVREYRPDLIILDVDMPEKDGGDIAAELKADPLFENVPIIFLSGLVSPEESGMRDGSIYLPKPVELKRLLNSVRTLLATDAVAARLVQTAAPERRPAFSALSAQELLCGEAAEGQ